MDEENFNRQLNVLIEQIKSSNEDSDSAASYAYLLDKLSGLSINNINNRKDIVLHFLVDSYNGNNQLAGQIAEFLQSYSKG
jgi:hypothetical protein